MKGQDKSSEKQLNKVEIGNLTEKELRITIMKIIQDLGKRMEAKIKKKWAEMNSTLEGINSRITQAEEWISDLEDRMVKIIAAKQNIEKRVKKLKVA